MSARTSGAVAGGMFGGPMGATYGALGGPIPGTTNRGLGARPIMASAGFNPDDLDKFAATEEGRAMGQDKIKALQTAGYNGKDYYSGTGLGQTNVNDLAGPYLAWLRSQERLKKDQTAYSALVKDQPGRDQTILGGPERPSILGS